MVQLGLFDGTFFLDGRQWRVVACFFFEGVFARKLVDLWSVNYYFFFVFRVVTSIVTIALLLFLSL